MTSASRRIRQRAYPVLLVGIAGAVVACGHAADHNPTPGGHAISSIDISRIDEVQNDFPPGFTVTTGLSKTLDEDDVRQAGIHVLSEAQLDPPHCLAAIIPPYADLTGGTEAAGVTANSDRGGIHVTALRLPEPVAAGSAPDGCDRIRVTAAKMAGIAYRIAVPHIDGVTTTGVKLVESGKEDDYVFRDGGDHIIQEYPDYLLTAAVDDRTVIVVRGAVDAALDPQRLFPDLLVKAVAAVRGPQ